MKSTTSTFGFQPVAAPQRQGLVNGVFRRVAGRYDIMNDAMSLGMHRLWKRDFLGQLALRPHEYLLDVAGGTGDIALGAARRCPDGQAITLCDINPSMLAEAAKRLHNTGQTARIRLVTGNAEALPFPAHTFHALTIAFGLRNVTDIDAALASFHRVLKPGGRFLCLEFSQPSLPWLSALYDRYSFQVIPWLGGRIADDRASYQYLVESIRRFPGAEQLQDTMEKTGFVHCRTRLYHNGIVAVHSGYTL